MWQRFSESARKAIFYAQEESTRQGHNAIIPDHLLLGLLVEEDTLAFRTLTALGVDIDAVRNEVRRRMKPEQGLASADMTLTLEGKKVIDLAYREAQALNNNYVGTEHMLLGVLAQGKGEGAEVLTGLGVHPDAARREAVALQIREDRRTQDTGIHWSSLDADSKVALSAAASVAVDDGKTTIAPKHLFLALLRDPKTNLAQSLTAAGFDLEALRKAVQ